MAAPGGAAARAAVGAVGGGGPARPAGQQQQEGGAASMIKNVLRVFLLTQAVQVGIKYFTAPKAGSGTVSSTTPSQASGGDGATVPAASNRKNAAAAQPGLVPAWPQGTTYDVHFFVTGPDGRIDVAHPDFPHYTVSGLKLGDWKPEHEWNTEVVLPKSVQNNGTLYLDTFLTKDGSPLSPREPGWSAENVYHYRKPLMQYQKLKRVRAVKSLLGGKDQEEESEEEAKAKDQAMPIIAYYHPNITMNIIASSDPAPITSLIPVLQQYYSTLPPAPGSNNPRYYPIIYPNTFWQLREAAFPINETVKSVPLNVKFAPLSLMKFNLYASMDESFRQAANNPAMGGAGVAEFDEVKRVFLETNIWLLLLTGTVTVLHSLFEFLAFKNDVSHWKNRKDQTGVSLRTIITNIVVQLITTLYLIDNSTDTSVMIVAGQGIGLLIEAWKITKAVDVKVVQSNGILPFKIQIKDKHVLSQEEKDTQVYDKLAFKWVIWGTTPFLVGYTIYSMLYEQHRGWYSFVITTLCSFCYMFGFVTLIPQLIINWKLKSVAHMPMKSLTYKALNTVIDDIFSFVIRMPTLHRLACFRDDVVFVILLYQYWIYPVDKKRANEYGQTLEDKEPEKSDEKKEAKKAEAIKETKKNK
ncbi:cleft lip and palate transmembrane 1 [Cystobasidium minutum MCA 4210]|uniref:cleft lip and palate transmembrane 1 n=1 Tax=Cystobasidium minutum MCA 4210 TaxID=1397322 RepID=UPI0034CE9830|eukprot:jgi/Rhomi1/196265/gm1.4479_g